MEEVTKNLHWLVFLIFCLFIVFYKTFFANYLKYVSLEASIGDFVALDYGERTYIVDTTPEIEEEQEK